MSRTKKPVEIHTSNKWSTERPTPRICRELEVELDRLTLDDHQKTNHTLDPVVHFNDSVCGHAVEEDDDDEAVTSTTPRGYHEEDRLFHLNFVRANPRSISAYPKIYKNGTRKSLTFTNERMREIERTNRILLQKILSKGPRAPPKPVSNASTQNPSEAQSRVTSAVNRRKQQRQIEMDNEQIRKRLLTISNRK